MASKGKQLKALIHAPEILITPGVYDGISTRLIQASGFRTASISGAGLSESRLGWPDRGLMSYDDVVGACRSLAGCSDLLLQGDADTGYGNTVNVYFTVKGFEQAGLAAIMIEDQVAPKRCGHYAGKDVISAEEMVEKIHAAVEAKIDPDFVIKARTDAASTLGVKEVVRRLNLYAEAGADCLFADALLSFEDISFVAANVSKPLSVNMGLGLRERDTTPLIHPRRLQEVGVAQVSYPRLLTTAALKGMQNAMAAFGPMLESGETVDRPDLLSSFKEISELMGLSSITEMEKRFASS